jgi:death on curing protein
MSEPRWITMPQIVQIHAEQLAIFGGPPGLRDAGLLEAAIDRPRNKFAYGEDDWGALAAAYAYGLAKNHPFIDGNKRIAFVSIIVFLEKNGVVVDLPQPDAVRVIVELAASKLSEKELANWIREHIIK